MKIPTELKHKPVVVVEDYKNIDGRDAYKSDVHGLSLGLAQWNDRGKVDISAKVWRYTGQKWSRQSEELPIHRILDLAILICKSKQYFGEVYKRNSLYDENDVKVDRVGLQGDAMTIELCKDNKMIEEDIQLFYDRLSEDDEIISERLRTLAGALKGAGY